MFLQYGVGSIKFCCRRPTILVSIARRVYAFRAYSFYFRVPESANHIAIYTVPNAVVLRATHAWRISQTSSFSCKVLLTFLNPSSNLGTEFFLVCKLKPCSVVVSSFFFLVSILFFIYFDIRSNLLCSDCFFFGSLLFILYEIGFDHVQGCIVCRIN
jgi:hypothetical protein